VRTTDANGNPSVLQVGWTTLATVNREGGKVLVAGYTKAKELNEQHNVTGRIAAGASAAYDKAKKLDEEHRIRERTASAVSNTYKGAVELNEKHQVTQVCACGGGECG
jgi:hypothetical protein